MSTGPVAVSVGPHSGVDPVNYTQPQVVSQGVPAYQPQYVDAQGQPISQPVTYVDAHGQPIAAPVTYVSAAQPQYLQEPAPPVQYVDEYGRPVELVDAAGQPINYVDEQGQPIQYVDAQGQPVTYGAPPQATTYVDAQGQPVEYVDAAGNPVTFVDEAGNPVQYAPPMAEGAPVGSVQYTAPYVAQPSVFTISPETFARLAQGGQLTQGELDSMNGAQGLPQPETSVEPSIQEVTDGQPQTTDQTAGVASAPVADKKSSKKRSLGSKKKKSKGCC